MMSASILLYRYGSVEELKSRYKLPVGRTLQHEIFILDLYRYFLELQTFAVTTVTMINTIISTMPIASSIQKKSVNMLIPIFISYE